MKFSGKISVDAPRTQVFDSIKDIEFFASCIDGVQDLEKVDETHYTGVLATKVAYIQFRFRIELEITHIVPPERFEALVIGAPIGVVGRFKSVAITNLVEDGDHTIIDYSIDANVTGKLGSIGQPVMKSKAKEMEVEFGRRLRAAFADDEPEATGDTKEGAALSPRQGGFERLLAAIKRIFGRDSTGTTKDNADMGEL